MGILLCITHPERYTPVTRESSHTLYYEGLFRDAQEARQYIIEHEMTDDIVTHDKGNGITVYVVGDDLTVYVLLDTFHLRKDPQLIGKFSVL